jgi:GxxExxY protein
VTLPQPRLQPRPGNTEQREEPERNGARDRSRISKEDKASLDLITERVIGCAIEVHRTLGPGFHESIYEKALCLELERRGIRFLRQVPIAVAYKGDLVGELRLDLMVEDAIIVEVKAVERFDPIHSAQLASYLKATGRRVGLLINFNVRVLKAGIRRVVL